MVWSFFINKKQPFWARATLVAFLIFLTSVLGFQFVRKSQEKSVVRDAVTFDHSAESLGRIEPESVLQELKEPYKLLSSLTFARGLGNYEDVSQSTSYNKRYCNLALIRWGYQALNSTDVEEILRKVEALSREKSYCGSFAGEISALAYLRVGSHEAADEILKSLVSDDSSPFFLRQRVILYFIRGMEGVEHCKVPY